MPNWTGLGAAYIAVRGTMSSPLLSGAGLSCPFCTIAAAFPPVAPSQTGDSQSLPRSTTESAADPFNPEKTFPSSYVLLSTPDVLAFLDIAPLTRGHVLLATRRHCVKSVDLTMSEGAEVRADGFGCRNVPILTSSFQLPCFLFWEDYMFPGPFLSSLVSCILEAHFYHSSAIFNRLGHCLRFQLLRLHSICISCRLCTRSSTSFKKQQRHG